MRLKKFHAIIQETPEEVREDIRLSMDILDRLNDLLNEKFEGKQHLLAKKMNKTEAEVSRWFSGIQNFTMKTIVRLEHAFGEQILAVCSRDTYTTYTQTAVRFKDGHARVSVDCAGKFMEHKERYEDIKKIAIKNSLNKEKELPA